MNKKDIVIGLVILAVVAAIVYFVRRPDQTSIDITPTTSVEEEVENMFKLEIPEDVEKTELKDVKGGDGFGIVTRKYENGKFEFTVMADLPDLSAGEFYQVFLGDDSTSFSLGVLRIAKGGYILEYTSGIDYSKYNEITVSKQTKSSKTPENPVLEGAF